MSFGYPHCGGTSSNNEMAIIFPLFSEFCGNGGNATTTDTTSPVITLLGDNPAVITVGSSYIDLGATVTDTNENGEVNNNLGLHFNVNGVDVTDISIDTTATSTNTVVFSAVDGAGNWGYATRTVEVVE
jgi:hypothetical protein